MSVPFMSKAKKNYLIWEDTLFFIDVYKLYRIFPFVFQFCLIILIAKYNVILTEFE